MKGVKTFFFAVLALGLASAAQASDAGGASHLNWGDFMWRMVNFVIFAAILYKFGAAKIVEFFGGRRKQIETQLADLEARKTKAEQQLSEVEKNIVNLEAERQKVLAEFKAQGLAMQQAIVDKAQADAEKIRSQAAASAEQERIYKLREIRAEVAEMVVAAAETIIREKLTAEEQEKLIDKYLTKVVLN